MTDHYCVVLVPVQRHHAGGDSGQRETVATQILTVTAQTNSEHEMEEIAVGRTRVFVPGFVPRFEQLPVCRNATCFPPTFMFLSDRPYQVLFTRLMYSAVRGYAPLNAALAQSSEKSKPDFLTNGLRIGDCVHLMSYGEPLYLGFSVGDPLGGARTYMPLPNHQPIENPLEEGVDYLFNPKHFEAPSLYGATSDGSPLHIEAVKK